MTAIEASFVRLKSMADGSLQITAEVEPRNAVAAFMLFASPGTPMALAAIKCATSAPAETKPVGGELAKWCAIRCGETAFQRWIQERHLKEWEAAPGNTPATWAASVIRAVCGIESRAELDSDLAAAARFDRLIRRPWIDAAG